MSKRQKEILGITNNYIKETGKYPALGDLLTFGITRSMVREAFGSLESIKAIVSKDSKYIFDLEFAEKSSLPKKKRLVFTTAVTGSRVDLMFYKNLKAYCKKFDADLVILVSQGKGKDLTIDPILRNDIIITNDISLNDNLFILGIRNQARTTDPITGLPRIGQRNGTFVSASPKQRLKLVATGVSRLPHALMSTGAITLPNYSTSKILIDKSSYLAELDHVIGALIIEIKSNDIFHYRQISADIIDGSFIDLNTKVTNGKFKNVKPEAFVLGDLHSGETCPVTMKAWTTLSKSLNPKSWIIHDGYDAKSTNHHTQNNHLTRAKVAMSGGLEIEKELNQFVSDIYEMSKHRTVVLVKSNHDEHLDRYLNEARYVTEPHNHKIALELAAQQIEGINPLEYYFNKKIKKTKHPVVWLSRDESYKVAGIELGAHGDLGANGSRGSVQTLEQAYGSCVVGHSHTPQIYRNVWVVGTSSHLLLDYNRGASSWFNTSCLVYPNGQRQMINSIDGEFTTRKL